MISKIKEYFKPRVVSVVVNPDMVEREWYRMSVPQAYRLARPHRVKFVREVMARTPTHMRHDAYKGMAGCLSHAEVIVTHVEFGVCGP